MQKHVSSSVDARGAKKIVILLLLNKRTIDLKLTKLRQRYLGPQISFSSSISDAKI